MRTFISFEEARSSVLDCGNIGKPEQIPLSKALGRTIAGHQISPSDVPPFRSSAMDGYAVLASDFNQEGQKLRIGEHIPAGHVPQSRVESGSCARIMTGAMIPEGADAVVPQEWVLDKVMHKGDDYVTFERVPAKGQHVRAAAEDLRRGETVFSGGELITPPVVGMLASIGADPISVVEWPRVALISTGDEIVPARAEPSGAQIRNSNGPALRAQALEAGAECSGYDHAADAPEAIRAAIELRADSELIVFCGGVSVGEHDYVREVLLEMGAEMIFWKVRQRPGKPLAFGRLGNALFLGLPGNPASSAMCFSAYARPLILKMAGRSEFRGTRLSASLGSDLKKVEGLHYMMRGIAKQTESGELIVHEAGSQRSNLYRSLVRANCVVHLEEGAREFKAGAKVSIEPLPWATL